MSPHTTQFLGEFLAGKHSEDETRNILRLIDDSGALESEFAATLEAVQRKIPGLALNFEKLLSGDPIECDPLISQGNLAILRLDTLFRESYKAWTTSGGALVQIKNITTPENLQQRKERTHKREHSEKNYPPDGDLLNQTTNIILAAFRVQATLTHRREYLENPTVAIRSTKERASQPTKRNRFDEKIAPMRPLGGFAPLDAAPLDAFPLPQAIPNHDQAQHSDDSAAQPADADQADNPPSRHPQYTPPGFHWKILAPGLEEELDAEERGEAADSLYNETPTYSKPPFPGERIHTYPPFAPASEEDAAEIDAYINSLPEELRTAQTVGSVNDYVEAPVWRESEPEYNWLKTHAKIHRERAKAANNVSPANSVGSAVRTETGSTNNASPNSREEEPVTSQVSASFTEASCSTHNGAPCSDCGTPRSEHAEATRNASPNSKEEEPVTGAIVSPTRQRGNAAPSSVGSAVRTEVEHANNASSDSREKEPVTLAQPSNHCSLTSHQPQTTSHFPTEPAYHKRE